MTNAFFKYSGQKKLPISAFIITLNEEKNIARCLQSLAFCQEIIVVDSGSTDLTRKIAEEMGASVYINEFRGYKEQKQFALNLCTNEWVLSLDADERVSEDLYNFIANNDFQTSEIDGYEVRRLHRFLGQWIHHSGLYPDYKLRLFRRSKGQLVGERIHEVIEVQGKTEKLKLDILHHSWADIKEYFVTQIQYAAKVAENKFDRGQRVSFLTAFVRAKWTFFYRYFFRLGFLDGSAGLIIALGASIATAYKYLHLWELNKNYRPKSIFPKGFLKICLRPTQWFYSLLVLLRLKLYEWTCLKKHKLSVPVISVGNLSVGGSGKTPFTIWLARHLSEISSNKVAILTRGYKSSNTGQTAEVELDSKPDLMGDEAVLMKQKLKAQDVKVLVGHKRHLSGQLAIDKFNSNVLLLDDGFQYLQLERDRNICLIDCSDQDFDEILPLGSRREPLGELKRADVFVLTRWELNLQRKEKYCQLLTSLYPSKPVLSLKEGIKCFTRVGSQLEEYPKGCKVVAFCGLANPRQFMMSLKGQGLHLVKFITFADHHKYAQNDIDSLLEELEANEADFLVTSAKDAVKILQLDRQALDQKLLVAHLDIIGFDELPDDMSIQLRNLLGTDIFNTLRAVPKMSAEKIG